MQMVEPDAGSVETRLVGGEIACADCGGELRPWDYARRRTLCDHGKPVSVRPRRSRCRSCMVTHVLLPAPAASLRVSGPERASGRFAASGAGALRDFPVRRGSVWSSRGRVRHRNRSDHGACVQRAGPFGGGASGGRPSRRGVDAACRGARGLRPTRPRQTEGVSRGRVRRLGMAGAGHSGARSRADDLYFDAVIRARVRRWWSGRIVLLGDAASSVTIFGDGSSMAIVGA